MCHVYTVFPILLIPKCSGQPMGWDQGFLVSIFGVLGRVQDPMCQDPSTWWLPWILSPKFLLRHAFELNASSSATTIPIAYLPSGFHVGPRMHRAREARLYGWGLWGQTWEGPGRGVEKNSYVQTCLFIYVHWLVCKSTCTRIDYT